MERKINQYNKQLSQILETSQDFPGPQPTKILNNLFLGNEQNAMDHIFLSKEGITHVINCCEQDCKMAYFVPKHLKYLGFSAKDNDSYNIMQHYKKIEAFIDGAMLMGGKVLVHCIYGSNRSGALVTAYVMVKKQFGPLSAALFVKGKRGVVLTNKKFQEQLVKFAVERNLLETNFQMPTTGRASSSSQADEEAYFQCLNRTMMSDIEWPGNGSKILDFLYLAGDGLAGDANTVKMMGITHVVNCVEGYTSKRGLHKFYGDRMKYMGFAAEDDQNYDIMQHFDDVYRFIEDARKTSGKVMVHCLAGINRSGALVTAYVMLNKNIGPISAAIFVKNARKVLLTNSNFQRQLIAFAKKRGMLHLDAALV